MNEWVEEGGGHKEINDIADALKHAQHGHTPRARNHSPNTCRRSKVSRTEWKKKVRMPNEMHRIFTRFFFPRFDYCRIGCVRVFTSWDWPSQFHIHNINPFVSPLMSHSLWYHKFLFTWKANTCARASNILYFHSVYFFLSIDFNHKRRLSNWLLLVIQFEVCICVILHDDDWVNR